MLNQLFSIDDQLQQSSFSFDYNSNLLTQLSCSSMCILFSLLFIVQIFTTPYRLFSQTNLNITDIFQVTAIQDNQLVVVSTPSTLSVMGGDKYQKILSQFDCNCDLSQLRISQKGWYVSNGVFLKLRNYISVQYQVEVSKQQILKGNLLVTERYILVTKYDIVPILLKLDLGTMSVSQIKYEDYSTQMMLYGSIVKSIGNKTILFTSSKYLLVIDADTFQVKQCFKNKHQTTEISIYTDQATNQNTVYVGRALQQGQQWSQLIFDHNSNKYNLQVLFVSPNKGAMHLTSAGEGVVFYRNSLLYLGNFHSIVETQTEDELWNSIDQSILAISNNQNMFVVKTITDNNISCFVYALGQDYYATKVLQIQHYKQSNIKNYLKIVFSQQDRYLFLHVVYEQLGMVYIMIAIVDMSTFELNYMQNQQQLYTIASFCLIEDGSELLYLVLQQIPEHQLKIELRQGTDKIVSTLELTEEDFFFAQLLSHSNWGNNFVLCLAKAQNQSIIQVYEVEDKTRIKPSGYTLLVNSSKNQVCGQYLLVTDESYQRIQFYHHKNLSLVRQIDYDRNIVGVLAHKDILIVLFYVQKKAYDLSAGIREIGTFFMEDHDFMNQHVLILQAEKKLILQTAIDPSENKTTSTVLYNFTLPTLLKSHSLQITQIICSTTLYFINKIVMQLDLLLCLQKVKNLFGQGVRMHEIEVVLSAAVQYVDPKIQVKDILCRLIISQDQKYIINMDFSPKGLDKNFVEVRSIANLSHVVHFQLFASSGKYYYFDSFYADVVNDSTLVMHDSDTIFVRSIGQTRRAEEYHIGSIEAYAVNGQKRAVISGKSLSGDKSKLILLDFEAEKVNPIFQFQIQSKIVLTSLSQDSQYVAIYQQNGQLLVLQVAAKDIVFNQSKTNVCELKFINGNKLLIQYLDGFEIVELSNPQRGYQLREPTNKIGSRVSEVIVNNNGDTIAWIEDEIVRIETTSAKTIFKNTRANQNIVGLSFMDNNSLLVATKQGTLYLLDQQACAQNQVIRDSICVCEQPYSDLDGKCSQISTQNLPIWLIVVIITGGLLVIILIMARCYQIRNKKMVQLVQQSAKTDEYNYGELSQQSSESRQVANMKL